MKSRTIILGLFAATLMFFWQCATNPTEPDGPAANEIWFQSGSVTPPTLTVSRGTTVEWVNMDSESHAVDSGAPGSPTGLFQSLNLLVGESFPHTFTTAGPFNYYCLKHSTRASERGTVIVTQ